MNLRRFCAMGAELSLAQRARVLPPVFWRDVEVRRAAADERTPRCADRFARLFVDALMTPMEKAALLANYCRDAEELVAVTHGVFLDRIVLDAIGRRTRQIVLLGSGMDSRPYRLDVPPQLKFVELDEPQVHDTKASVLKSAGISARCSVRRLDVRHDFALGLGDTRQLLIDELDARRPSLFVVDGELLATWSAGVRRSVFADIARCSGDGSQILLQVLPAGIGDASAPAIAAAVAGELLETDWLRPDLVGSKALGRAFPGSAPSDESGLIVVAERGQAITPGRPEVTRS